MSYQLQSSLIRHVAYFKWTLVVRIWVQVMLYTKKYLFWHLLRSNYFNKIFKWFVENGGFNANKWWIRAAIFYFRKILTVELGPRESWTLSPPRDIAAFRKRPHLPWGWKGKNNGGVIPLRESKQPLSKLHNSIRGKKKKYTHHFGGLFKQSEELGNESALPNTVMGLAHLCSDQAAPKRAHHPQSFPK